MKTLLKGLAIAGWCDIFGIVVVGAGHMQEGGGGYNELQLKIPQAGSEKTSAEK